MKKDLELLKNSKVAYIVANVKWFDKEDSYTLVETAFEDKYIQLKREIDEEYKRKLTELEETKRWDC